MRRYVNGKALWKTVVLIIGLLILADPSAPLPLLLLYATVGIAAIILPIKTISNEFLIGLIGVATIVSGIWLYFGETATVLQLAGFVLLALIAIRLPYMRQISNRV